LHFPPQLAKKSILAKSPYFWIFSNNTAMSFPPSQTTRPNGGKSDNTFRYEKNAKSFPTRKELPQVEGTPPGA